MNTINIKGKPTKLSGNLPKIGTKAPNFTLTRTDFNDFKLDELSGKRLVLNIFVSVDTSVCANSVRKFNQEANELKNTQILCISADLPFALQRFCGAEGLKNVIALSSFRSDFGQTYGVEIAEGSMSNILSRAIVIIDNNGIITYTQQVPELTQDPNYEEVLTFLKD